MTTNDDKTLGDTAQILISTYEGISRVWPEVTPGEYRRIALAVLEGETGTVISVEKFIDDIIAAVVMKYGFPLTAIAILFNPPVPFNVGGYN